MRWYWWLLFLAPLVTFLAALDTARTARSADEALGHAFFTANFVIAGLLMAPVVLYRSAKSTDLSRGDRALILLMGAAVLPFIGLIAAIGYYYDGWPPGRDPSEGYPILAAGVLWLGLLIAARRTLHRGIPSGWSQLESSFWWMLCLLPPLSVFLAFVNMTPADSQAAEPLSDTGRSVLYATIALSPLLVHRALFSARATTADRVLIILAALSVIPLFLFCTSTWHFITSWPAEAGVVKWLIYLGSTAGWVALAVATRLKLKKP